MCGIAGYFSHNINPDEDVLNGLKTSIKRRGPDGAGVWQIVDKIRCDLFHRRLAIIDLSDGGAQPMCSRNSDWVITYNGEIYNYIELRRELQQLGHSFQTASDTEVLLAAWCQWGEEALSKLQGMFAFALYNKSKRELWLVRDRFGVKPLLWSKLDEATIIFSSSLHGLASLTKAKLDRAYCARGLFYKNYETAEQSTAFDGVKNVPPGCCLKINETSSGVKVEVREWYNLTAQVKNKENEIFCLTDEELRIYCLDTLTNAVAIRLRSDVPLAISLSGGLDSSSIISLANSQNRSATGFCYGSPDDKKSEGAVVKRFSISNSIPVTFVWPSYNAGQIVNLLHDTSDAQEAPFSSLSVMAQNAVYKHVSKENYKVLLGGQGADEIFAGYRKFFIVQLRDALHGRKFADIVSVLQSLSMMLTSEIPNYKTYLNSIKRYGNKASNQFKVINWSVTGENILGSATTSLRDRQIQDIQYWSLPSLLRYEDRNSMWHGIESRLPFMDHRIVELALALPVRLKLKNGYGKYLLRQAVRNHVPNFIRLERKKRGFDVTQNWISNGLGTFLSEYIQDNCLHIEDELKDNISLAKTLTKQNFEKSESLLDEALMLFWMINYQR